MSVAFLPLWSFALAAGLPGALFLAAGLWGGPWVLAGFLYMAALSAVLDSAIPLVAGNPPEGAEFPGSDAVLAGLGLGLLLLAPLVVWAVAGPSALGPWSRLALFAGFGLWAGQVGHPVAHELIHRGQRPMFLLGTTIYAVLLVGHHVSAHRLVHHAHVGTRADPNTARPGEGYYRFLLRAWPASFRAGLRAETALRQRRKRGPHPYLIHLALALAALALARLVAGPGGALVWAGIGLFTGCQILLSDYVQHYGLHRRLLAPGQPEPVSARLSWNTAHWFSAALMVNAPRHSDHHAHPGRPYPALILPGADAAPRLPWPLPVACTLALVPPLWRRAIAPHLDQWRSRQPMP